MLERTTARVSRAALPPGAKIRVLVVDDSVVIRRLVTLALDEDPQIEVVGSAANGKIALQRIPQVNPDVITLDVEMPEMDGIETLRHLARQHPKVRVIMFSTMTERGAAVTLEALQLGASDYVAKAANVGSLDVSLRRLRDDLIPKIKQFFRPAEPTQPAPLPVARPAVGALARMARRPRRMVAIGTSTGGPNALAKVFAELPGDLPAPVVLVQHMPPLFTRLLAERLESQGRLRVREARGAEELQPGTAYLAPGDYHLVMHREGARVVTALNQDPAENSCRPAVDVLFRSVAEIYGGEVVGVILTGMGQDGFRGIEALKGQGAYVIAQDEASSVVWGMPGVVVKGGLADEVTPIEQVARAIVRQVTG